MDSEAAIMRPATNIDRRQCKRVVPMQVLVLGQSRTGTTSIRGALYELGYDDVYHYSTVIRENPRDSEMWLEAYKAKFEGKGKPYGREEFDKLLGHCAAVTDHPCVCFGEDLIKAYPEAKVVLSVRDNVDVWYKSVEQTIWPFIKMRYGPRQSLSAKLMCMFGLIPPLPGNFQEMTNMSAKYSGFGEFPEKGKQYYLEQNEKIRQLVPQERLLEFNVKEGWGPLCEFLGKEAPTHPFPRHNDSKYFAQRSAKVREMVMRKMYIKLAKTFGAMLVLGFVAYYARSAVALPSFLKLSS